MRHPAKYTDSLLPVFEEMLTGCESVLDPFAGTGKIHSLPFKTTGLEIEPEWAEMHPDTVCGDATAMPFEDNSFDAICTSPTYGNRMADHHNAKDGSKRNTYTHCIGHKLHENNSGKMQWGHEYRMLHENVYAECFRVLRPNGRFVLNIKNHIRKGKEIDVFSWHISTLIALGFMLREVRRVYTNGNGFGANADKRTGYEFVALLEEGRLI